MKIAAFDFLTKIFNSDPSPSEKTPDPAPPSAEAVRNQLAGIEQRQTSPNHLDMTLEIQGVDGLFEELLRTNPSIKISQDPEVMKFLNRLQVPESCIKAGSFKPSDITDGTERNLTKALLCIVANRSSRYNDEKGPRLPRKQLHLGPEIAKMGGFLLDKHLSKVQALFGPTPLGCGKVAMNAVVLENFLENHRSEYEVFFKTPRKVEFERLASCPMSDYLHAGFSEKDLRGLHFPSAGMPNYDRAAQSVVPFISESYSTHQPYKGSAVLIKAPHAPGGVQVLTALHCIDKDAFDGKTSTSSANPKNYKMKILVNKQTYYIDPASMKTPSAGDFAIFTLQPKPKSVDLSKYAARVANGNSLPKSTDDLVAIGYPGFASGKLSFTGGSFISDNIRLSDTPSNTALQNPASATNQMVVIEGYSGGGMFNKQGELVGINTAKHQVAELSYFYPFAHLQYLPTEIFLKYLNIPSYKPLKH